MIEATLIICNKRGLHARAAAKFVKIVEAHEARVSVTKPGGDTVVGGSILGLMMLGADCGTVLHVSADGKDAEAVVAALVQLVDDKFGEGE